MAFPFSSSAGRKRVGAAWSRKVAPMPVSTAPSPAQPKPSSEVTQMSLDEKVFIHVAAKEDAAAPELSAKLARIDLLPPDSRTILVTQSCPPQMVQARVVGRGLWAYAQFELLKLVGSGKISNVYQACCIRSSTVVALKVYPKKSLSDLNQVQVQRELDIHSRLHHASVLELYAVFEDADAFYFVMQFAPRGDLFHELKRCGGCFSERRAVRDVIYPMLSALAYMHSENIIHRDVKPENTLVSDSGSVLLADFGLSIDCGRERPSTRLGTLDYMAPETLRCPDKDARAPPGPQLYDGKVDSWAMGILAFEILVGRAPFEQECKQTTCDLICYGDYVMPYFLSPNARDFISRALCKKASARPTIAELLAHPWMSGEARRNSIPSAPTSGGAAAAAAKDSSGSGARSSARSSLMPATPPIAARLALAKK